jgi:5-methylcytosine-specific restriction endonuclease McrA
MLSIYKTKRLKRPNPNVASKAEYDRRRDVMIERQLGRCAICLKVKTPLQFDHALGRGMGGKHRSDEIWEEDGSPKNAALCAECNSLKSSKRYEYRDGIYQPKVKA